MQFMKLSGGQQPRMGLCRRYPSVHLPGSLRVRRPQLGSTIRGGTGTEGSQRRHPGIEPAPCTC
jgi:hypothetical protein